VTQLQKATVGAGIDVVLMGDGYSDRLIADGTYAATMKFAWESLFTEEPYKGHKEMFNVYVVDVVSENEIFANDSSTALSVVMNPQSTATSGDDATAIRYGLKAIITGTRMDNAVLVVMVNSTSWHGTCWMYPPQFIYDNDPTNDNKHGDGLTISYFSKGQNDGQLRMLLHHETNGHGFVKLGDEYWYDDNGVVTDESLTKYQNAVSWGWYRNIDLTGDPDKVKWAKFLSDSRYAGQGLGVYEGAYYVGKGAWRSTDNSIMRRNYGGFNAPSREAIYYRIHKLAYGADWQYDYEEFVEWDLAHYTAPAHAAQAPGFGVLSPVPHTPPVVVARSWREAVEK
jgi:hypothetical protein